MNNRVLRRCAIVLIAIVIVFASGALLAACDRPSQPAQIEQDDSDCDWGDMHQQKVDEDCGFTLGTPQPKATRPAVRKTGGTQPRPASTRRR